MNLYERPRLVIVYMYGLILAISGSTAVLSKSIILQTGALSVALVTLVVGGAALWNWWAYRANDHWERRKYIEIQTPFSYILRFASSLSTEQAAVVPKLDYQAQVLVTVGATGVLGFMLATSGGAIPYEWIWDYLQKCGMMYVYPVGRFNDKTNDRLFCTALIAWMMEHSYVLPSAGPNTYQWMTDQSKSQFVKQIQLHELLAFSHYSARDHGWDERGDDVVRQ